MGLQVKRLCNKTLPANGAGVRHFEYDRSNLRPRIMHLGLGAFYRAHGLLFTEDCGAAAAGWGTLGVSLKRPDQRDKLAPQDFLYSAVEKGPQQQEIRIVGGLMDVLVATENPATLLAKMAAPETAILTLTITEKGYCHDPANGHLNFEHPDIKADLALPHMPCSAIGFIVAALAKRRAAGHRPFVIASCDNLPHNGQLLAGLLLDFAKASDRDLASWIEDEVRCPCSMVDRIVPAETAGDLQAVEAALGVADLSPVSHEPFRQWVLQDHFAQGGRPQWEQAGAQFVADVAPFEAAKLRMLNGAHSALAYLGYLAGHETIVDAVHDEVLARYIQALWATEIVPTLHEAQGLNLQDYASQLLTRFNNPAIRHRTWQIAMDGSQKLPQRLLGTLRDQLRAGRSITLLAYAIAGWLHYVQGIDERGKAIDVRDPLLPLIKLRLAVAGNTRERIQAALHIDEIFGTDLRESKVLLETLHLASSAISTGGVRTAIAALSQV